MEKIFLITKTEKGYNLTCKSANTYNKYGVKDLFKAMNELADIFNNALGVGILFEVQGN